MHNMQAIARGKNSGFTLVEVLVSLVIVAIGIVAILQLQGLFLQTASDAEKRAVATALAEKQFEHLREFDNVTGYNLIGSGSTSSAETVLLGSTNVTYDLDWSDITPWVSGGTASINNSDYKEITLKISWDGGESSLAMSSIIAKIDPNISALIDKSGFGGELPDVDYTPGVAPDVISVDLGNGLKKETSKPLPDVTQKGTSTIVQFETVTYDSNREITEDFLSLNCVCQLGSLGNGLKASKVVYNASIQALETEYPNTFETKQTGTVYNSGATNDQPNICDRCCRDHHDSDSGTDDSYRWYWPGVGDASQAVYFNTGTGDHWHFDSTFTKATNVGEIYLESCRFKRVDGIYRLMQDWKLLDMTVMPYNYLASGSQGNADYTAYITDYIGQLVENMDLSTPASTAKPTGRDLVSGAMGSVAQGTSTQLLARGIYVDPLTSSAVSAIKTIKGNSGVWLNKVPFYEINLTLLANWLPSDAAIADVTNDPVVTIVDPSNNYYGDYSRGLMSAVSTGTASISAESLITNTGLLGHRNAANESIATDNIFDTAANTLTDSISVEVIGSGIVSGQFSCYRQSGNNACTGQNVPAYLDMDVRANSTACLVEKQGSTWLWTCTVPDAWSDNVTFGYTGYEFFDIAAGGVSDAVANYSLPASVGDTGFNVLIVIP